ncbi:MAG TPA: DUF1540 domain-containing protein [Firmicutes bacterium]|nr:DUF1540 domain-containing protein [Bacillota bacterium]
MPHHHPKVVCEADTCTHWLPGDVCGAANIDILNEEEQAAESVEHTMCKTFAERRGLANLLGSADNVNWRGAIEAAIIPGKDLSPTTTCVVDSCVYWEEGNLCAADEIFISGSGATECQDTNCETFRKK